MPRRKTTPVTESVWDSVPNVVAAEQLLTQTSERLASMSDTPSPEEARQTVIDAAVEALRTEGAPIPSDIGERAAAAHTAALAPHAERLALQAAVNTLRRRIPFLKSRGSRVVLTTLATQLDEVLTEVRAIVERSGPLDGDSAIEAGERGIADYKRLRELVGVVDEVRRVQRSVYAEVGDIGVLSTLYRKGHDQFRGVPVEQPSSGESAFRRPPHADALPADVQDVVTGKRRRDVPFLIYMAQSGRAWLPTSVEELEDAARSAEDVGRPDDDANPLRQREVTIPEPSAPRHTNL